LKPILLLNLLFFSASFLCATPFKNGSTEAIISYIKESVEKKDKNKTLTANLVQALEKPDNPISLKEHAAWALGQLEIRSASGSLIKAAQHKSLLVRASALDSLMHLRARTALPIYIEIAEKDPVLNLRQWATLAMGLLRWSKAIDPLVKLSSDSHEEIRGASVLSMAATHSRHNNFSEIINEMSQDKSTYVQKRAEMAKDVINRKNLLVRKHLESPDPDIRLFGALYFHYHGSSNDLNTVKSFLKNETDKEVRYELWQAKEGIRKRIKREKQRKEQAHQREKKTLNSKP